MLRISVENHFGMVFIQNSNSDIKIRRTLWRHFGKFNPMDYGLAGIGKSPLKFRNYFFKFNPLLPFQKLFIFLIEFTIYLKFFI